MLVQTIYIQGTKKSANESLKNGTQITGTIYGFNQPNQKVILNQYTEKAVIKFYKKLDPNGTPIANTYARFEKGKII